MSENDAQADALARGDVVDPAPAPAEETTNEEQLDLPLEAPEEAPAEPEAEAEAAEEKPVEDDAEGHRIPKARFDEAVQRERERAAQAEAQLKQYQQREQQQLDAEDFTASQEKQAELLKQHSSLLADGELEKASEVMGQVLQLRDDMQNARMVKQADNARNSARIEVQYDATVQRLETEYPEINPDAPEFDQAAVRRVQMMITGLMQGEGKNPAEALQEATDILLKPAKEAVGKDLRDKPSEEAVQKGMRRTQQQIDKNIKAAEAQPPMTDEVGQDHDKTGGVLNADQISNMSWEEFVSVPDDELAKLRGDFIQ